MANKLSVLIITLLSTVVGAQNDCPVKTTDECVCEDYEGGQNIWCPNRFSSKVRIFYKLPGNLWLTCNPGSDAGTTSTDLVSRLRSLNVGDKLDFFEIRHCPIPNASLAAYVEAMGATSLKVLKIWQGNFSEAGYNLVNRQFDRLDDLTDLFVKAGRIDAIEKGAFGGLSKLQSLTLTSTGVDTLEPETFSDLSALKRLGLIEKAVSNLPRSLLAPLTNLTQLKISLRGIESVPKSLFEKTTKLLAIKMLDVHGGGRGRALIPKGLLEPLSELRNVTFVGQGAEALPDGLFAQNGKLERFEWLFYRCKETAKLCSFTLPTIFRGSTSLKSFSFVRAVRAKLNLTQDLFKRLNGLERVRIYKSRVENIPKNLFRDATGLKEVDFSGNGIKELDERLFVKNPKLERVIFNGNKISNLGRVVTTNTRLKTFEMAKNLISRVDSRLFVSNTMLQVIDLSHNKLAFTEASMPNWDSVVFVKHVNFAHNNISLENFPYQWMSTWLQLETLNLSYNMIGPNLDMYSFNWKQPKLTLDLSHNQIQKIKFDLSSSGLDESHERSQHLELPLVNISHNHFACDCESLALAKALHGKLESAAQTWIKFTTEDVECLTPRHLAGRAIRKLDWDEFSCEFPSQALPLSCPPACSCSYTPHTKRREMVCSDADGLFIHPSGREDVQTSLTVRSKSLSSLEPLARLDNYNEGVTSLILSDCDLGEIRASDLPDSLNSSLDLSNNRLANVDGDAIKRMKRTSSVWLRGNPFRCDCNSAPLYTFIKENSGLVRDYSNVTFACGGDEDRREKLVSEITDKEEFCTSNDRMILYVLLPTCVAMLIVVSICAGCCCFKQPIKIYLYSKPFTRYLVANPEEEGRDLPNDVFVSYANEDQEFTEQYLVPGLEQNGDIKYKCLVHVRDFVPGKSIADNIMEAVNSSRRTLVCLSKDYCESRWSKYEFALAHQKNKVIVVNVGNDMPTREQMGEDLHNYVITTTYLDKNDKWFWEKLRFALPHRNKQTTKGWFCIGPRRKQVHSDHVQLVTKTQPPRGASHGNNILVEDVRSEMERSKDDEASA